MSPAVRCQSNTDSLRRLVSQVVKTAADAIVTLVALGLVGYLDYSSLVGVLGGALLGFLLTPTCLSIGQQAMR
jgi:hypothetical protein